MQRAPVKLKQRDSEETILYAVLDVSAKCWPTSILERFIARKSQRKPRRLNVGLSVLQAAFPLTTVTQPVPNRRMDRCSRIEQRNGWQQRRPERRTRVETQRRPECSAHQQPGGTAPQRRPSGEEDQNRGRQVGGRHSKNCSEQ